MTCRFRQAGGDMVDHYRKIKERAKLDRLADYFADVEEDFIKDKEKDLYQKRVDAAYERSCAVYWQILPRNVRRFILRLVWRSGFSSAGIWIWNIGSYRGRMDFWIGCCKCLVSVVCAFE